MPTFIYSALQVVFIITAVILLCVFRKKNILSGSFDIGPSHSFCKIDKEVWLPRYFIASYKKRTYATAKADNSNHLFLYYGEKLHSTSYACILSPHLVFLSFLLNRILNDVHIIAFFTAAAIFISVISNPDLVFFTPVLLPCTAFLGAQWKLNILIRIHPRHFSRFSLNISGNSKLQKEFVRPGYLFFSAISVLHELSVLLLTMQAVCSIYTGSGALRAANLLCTCILLAFSVYLYVKNPLNVYPKKKKDIIILFAEMVLCAAAILAANTTASQAIHFTIAPAYIFPLAVALILFEPVSTRILSIYAPSDKKLARLKRKYRYKSDELLFSDYTFLYGPKAERYKEYYLPEKEAALIRKEKEQKRLREEKEKEEQRIREEKEKEEQRLLEEKKKKLRQLREEAQNATGSTKLDLQYQIMKLQGDHEKAAWFKKQAEIQRQKEIQLAEERRREKVREEYRRRATIPLGSEMVTPEEYDQFCRRYGYGKYKKQPDSSEEIRKKEKEGGYDSDIDSNNATDRFNRRR